MDLHTRVLFLLMLLLTSTTYLLHLAKSTPHNNFTDLEALLAFKDHITDPYDILPNSWTTNTSFCSWVGITCSRRHQRVAALYLRNFSLHGTISPHLTNLSFLSLLDLGNNSITGPIPDSLGQLRHLKLLRLDVNSLSGPIPSNLFNMSSLLEIFLTHNNLIGPLPSNNSITMLPYIQKIDLAKNQLTGQIPSSFAQCLDLLLLHLSFNNFTGTIPAVLGYLPKLRWLALSVNNLSGKIPSSLGNLTMLGQLYLQEVNLEGEIPKELGNLLNLQILMLSLNSLTGVIPLTLLNASMIRIIDFSFNKLSGPVPSTIGGFMPRLKSLFLVDNQLNGSLDFITSLHNCRDFLLLHISFNELDGSLPDSVGNLSTSVAYFNVFSNRIWGKIPASFGNLSNLLSLTLQRNELVGEIPFSLARLQGLQEIGLGGNRIGGSIPYEFGLMTNLNTLSLEQNSLTGSIPDSMGNISNLQYLFLSANKLSSTVPSTLWRLNLLKINLSQNSLHGSIPPDVGNFRSLDTLDLSKNQFSGNISSALGQLQMLTYLDLSDNSFHGEIPKSLGELINIKYLNLSKNFLLGNIPKSLASLRYIESLDISFNQLEGQVPEGRVFSNLSITSLEGNKGLCDAPQLGFPPCPTNVVNSHSRRYLHSLKYILPTIAFIVIVIGCLFLIFAIHRRRKEKNLAHTALPCVGDHRLISYYDLVNATENFSQANLIGSGCFGSVFKGCLHDGLNIAVKVLNLDVEGASKSFDDECQVLCSVRHRNLVKIINICSNLDFKALILQFMSNGSLEQWLYSDNYYLSLLQRLNIMIDVASAVEYLHHHHPQVVLHCDLKPSNVLLDEEMVAHVGDFGIAKLLLGDKSVASTRAPGTIGYIAPEYGSTGKVSKMGDVYSFGILLLETFTRKKPTDIMFDGEANLRKWIDKAYPTAILDVVDHNISKDIFIERQPEDRIVMHRCLLSIIELGLLCSNNSPKERISMINIVPKLQKIKVDYLAQSFST